MSRKVRLIRRSTGEEYDFITLERAVAHLAKLITGRSTLTSRYGIQKRLETGERIETIGFFYELTTPQSEGT